MIETKNAEFPPKPPGAINALLNGFNAIASNIIVILFPAALDVFLWLGPRLKAYALFLPIIQEIMDFPQQDAVPPFGITPDGITKISKFWADFNFFSLLRTYPLGVFSLMPGNRSGASPLGARIDWEIPNVLVLISASFLLVCAGLFLGSLYFYFVSRVALKPKNGPNIFRATFHSLIVWVALTITTCFVAMPVLILGAFLLNNEIVTLLLFLLLAWPATWLGLMVFFSTHGVFILSKNAFSTITHNFRILRYGMPPMGWFALIAIIISQGMDLIWLNPTTDTWMALVGILGHAFISTGLLAASFIFYRDMNNWVDEALAWVKTHQITSARA